MEDRLNYFDRLLLPSRMKWYIGWTWRFTDFSELKEKIHVLVHGWFNSRHGGKKAKFQKSDSNSNPKKGDQ